ncbi:MAG: response regulator [Candidatus Marinimicrobia bacterium]|nr:response regulator [Candidatus Neomarinimicrobiota bacterium]
MESIGRLAGGIAHDFNNMLSVIVGYGDAVLRKLPQEDPLRGDVEEIIKAGHRSAALTRQLLAFSRRQTLQPEVLNLNVLILNLEKMLRSLIEEHIELVIPLYKDLANVIADPGQIEQVIMNLIVNARDAMPEGGKLIIETTNVELDEAYTKKHPGSTPGKHVMLAITDTGCGMDKETKEQIFEPFFTTKIKEKGTGLGLPTVYGIVKQSDGYIWVDSKLGIGTVVQIFLPQTTSQTSEKEKIDENKDLKGSGKHILIVEDEESVRSLVKDMLISIDYKISLAANGIEALQLVKDGLKPDLILTDVVMPEMGGAELKTHILKINPDLKVIFMSGYSDNAIGRRGEIDSTFNFIQKPFTAHDLFTKIHGVLQNGKAERPKKRILMIDDDYQFCELANRFFTRKGYNFVMVETTAAALATLTEQSIDVLLVDMNLPGTNGKLVLEAIRKAGHTAPAIILSGDLYFVNMDELRPLGAVDAIEKSSDFKPVMRMIEIIETKQTLK